MFKIQIRMAVVTPDGDRNEINLDAEMEDFDEEAAADLAAVAHHACLSLVDAMSGSEVDTVHIGTLQ